MNDKELRERGALIKAILQAHEQKERRHRNAWLKTARPNQLPPPGDDWNVWLMLAGRGFGKTRSGSEWITDQALSNPKTAWAVIAPVWRDTKDVPMAAVEKVLQENKIDYRYNKSDLHFYLPNGSEIVGYSADKPDRIRGSNLSGGWLDELAAFQRANELWYEALMPAVRIGKRPLILVTTTPRPTPLIKELVDRDDGSVVVVRGSTFDNAANLSPAALEELRRRYEGTRIGRQELYGELLMDAEFALWNRDLIEAVQATTPLPALMRTIVSVDPSGSADGDATGIVTAAVDRAGVIHILSDDTCGGSPQHRYETVCMAASRAGAGTIVYEAAYGGDNIAHGLKSTWEAMAKAGRVDEMVPLLKPSPTKQSKADRAHPVVALYEQTAAGMKRISHARPLPELEDEMVQWEPGCGWSPNRIDAMVHAVRFLAPQTRSSKISSSFSLPDLPSLPIG